MNIVKPVALAMILASLNLNAQAAGRGQFEIRPAQQASTLSRAEVQAEAASSRTSGRTVRGDLVSAEAPVAAPMTRAQVIAEMLEHRRLGLTPRGKHHPQATPEQAEQIRQAGLRARQNAEAAQSGIAAPHQH